MAKRLRKLLINRVDLVPAGANPDAHIMLYKAADSPSVEKQEYDESDHLPLTTEQILQRNALWSQWHPLWDAFTSSVWEVMSCCEDAAHHAPILMQSIDQFATKAHDLLSGLGLVDKAAPLFDLFAEVEKAGRVMSGRRMQRLKDAMTTLQAILDDAMVSSSPKEKTPAAKGDRMPEKTQDEATKRAETAEARVKELEAENATLKKHLEPEPTEEEYLKSLPEAMRKRWEENERQTKEALATAQEEKDKRERREYIEKAVGYRSLGMVPDDDWETLQAIDKLDVKPRTRLLHLLKSANEALGKSALFREMGHQLPSGNGTAWSTAEALAVEMVTKGQAATKEQAIVKVFEQNPELRRQYDAEKRGA